MASCEEKHSSIGVTDEGIGAPCLVLDDSTESPGKTGTKDESEMESFKACSWRTNTFWPSYRANSEISTPTPDHQDSSDCGLSEISDFQPPDTTARSGALHEISISAQEQPTQDTCQYVMVPVAFPIAPCSSACPDVEAALMQVAKEYDMKAAELEVEAWRLKNPHATQDQLMQKANEMEMQAAQLQAQARRISNPQTTALPSAAVMQQILEAEVTRSPNAKVQSSASANHPCTSTYTTVWLKDIPNNVRRQDLCDLLNAKGFKGKVDFIYLPMDFKRDCNLGYAFVNLESNHDAKEVFAEFTGFKDWGKASTKVCDVKWGQPLQGLDEHIARYRDSPVMHNSVQEDHKPMLLHDGEVIEFPAPTKRIRAPRHSRDN